MTHATSAIVLLLVAMATGCSTHVAADSVPGKYVATYDFGNDTLTLNRDGTFVQRVVLQDRPPVEARGSWTFDADRSKITLRGILSVVDGVCSLEPNWQVPGDAENQSVERLWFRVELVSGSDCSYVKQ